MMLLPVYGVMKRFFEKSVALTGVAVFAFNPVLVGRTADVLRGPIFWFFLSSGVYLFTVSLEKCSYRRYFFSGFFFLLAAWARIESLLFIIASMGFIFFFEEKGKLKKNCFFFAPIFLTLAAGGFFAGDLLFEGFFRYEDVSQKFFRPFLTYQELSALVEDLADSQSDETAIFFLRDASNFIWLIAVGLLLNTSLEAFFYLPFFFFVFGFFESGKSPETRFKKASKRYFRIVLIFSFLLLYLHVLQTWIMDKRFTLILLFSGIPFIGNGIQKTIDYLRIQWGLKHNQSLFLVFFVLLALMLPKDLSRREEDKLVFREISEYISSREKSPDAVKIGTSNLSQRWISFYANRHVDGAPCPRDLNNVLEEMPQSRKKFIGHVDDFNIMYVLFEEKRWPFEFVLSDSTLFRELARWHHVDTGEIILYEFIGSAG
jgi:hypothetical protein